MDDLGFLQRSSRPPYEDGSRAIRIADLFCGCGGLTLGLAEAARRLRCATDVRLALDLDESAVTVFRANFVGANVRLAAVEEYFPGGLGARLTPSESSLRARTGKVDILVGGPPCQGHSDLNNWTRRKDERNLLYGRMARAAVVLRPSIVVIENVPAVTADRHDVVSVTETALRNAGYRVGTSIINLLELGVPQRRRRHLLIAIRPDLPSPADVLRELRAGPVRKPRTLKWAIGDLSGPANGDTLHVAARVSPANLRRIAWLKRRGAYDLPNALRPECHRNNDHTYKSVYGRLRWGEPAQTITTGFGSMGQGRYVHPVERRTLTPREAARLQFFPDWFQFAVVPSRTAWSELIGNAVPPKLTMALGAILIPHLIASPRSGRR